MQRISFELAERLETYLDGTLSKADRAAVTKQLEQDPVCRDYLLFLKKVTQGVGRTSMHRAPNWFADKVMVRLRPGQTRPLVPQWGWAATAAALCLVIGFFVGAGWFPFVPVANPPVKLASAQADQVLFSLIQSLKNNDNQVKLEIATLLQQKGGASNTMAPLLNQAYQTQKQWFDLNIKAYRSYQQGDLPQALGLAQTAVDQAEMLWSPSHPNVAHALTNLGIIYLAQKKYPEAESALKRALDIFEAERGAPVPGPILGPAGDASLRQIVALRDSSENILRTYDKSVVLSQLSALCQDLGRTRESRGFLERSQKIREQITRDVPSQEQIL